MSVAAGVGVYVILEAIPWSLHPLAKLPFGVLAAWTSWHAMTSVDRAPRITAVFVAICVWSGVAVGRYVEYSAQRGMIPRQRVSAALSEAETHNVARAVWP